MDQFRRPDRKADFADTYVGEVRRDDLTPKELMAYALEHTPAWFAAMLRLRDRLGRVVGLKTAMDAHGKPDASFLLHLPVLRDDGDVYSSGTADKHLDFLITVERQSNAQVSFTTEVWFNGISGRIYLALILPFHRAILRHWVKVIARMPEVAT